MALSVWLRKIAGEAKMIFLSRFMRKKNFKWLLENLSQIEGKLTIDIYGPLEDETYWKECRQIIDKLPSNIKIASKGSIPHETVLATIVKYHFFILPTLGENFGHVFLEFHQMLLDFQCGQDETILVSNR